MGLELGIGLKGTAGNHNTLAREWQSMEISTESPKNLQIGLNEETVFGHLSHKELQSPKGKILHDSP